MTHSPFGFTRVCYHVEYIPQLIKSYMKYFEWPNMSHLKMIDIGTGPGHVLMKVESMIPRNYAEIICADKDRNMIDYFSSLPKNPKISSRLLDIESEKLPDELNGRFDFAFSSYCLTYVQNYRQAFRNTSKLLRPNGEMFFFWCQKSYLYDIYRSLNQTTKWAPYTNDFKNWHSLVDNDDPVGTIRPECEQNNLKILKAGLYGDIAFRENEIQAFLDMFSSLDIVSERIPKSDLPKYKEDFYNLVMSYISKDDSSEYKVKLPFPTIAVAAKKI